jgi:hypothetical protein
MSERDPFINPDEGLTPQQRADELFVHGLLGLLHDKDAQKIRVEKAMSALAEAPAAPSARRIPHHRRLRRLAALAATAVLVIAGVIIFEFPGSSAYATVSASADAAKGPGDRRYELRLAHWPKDEVPKDPTGTLDSSDGTFLLKFTAPDGHEVVVGKDKQSEWAIKLDGQVDRDHPRVAWPRWAEIGDDAMLGDSVDHLLEGLLLDFELTSDGRQKLPGTDGSRTFKHIRGERKPNAHKPQPQRVDLWINPDTNVLERLEMTWLKPPLGGDGGPRGPRGGPGDGRGPNGRQRPGPRPDGPGPEGRPDGPGPDGPGPDGQGDGPDGPDAMPGHRPGPPDGPDGPPNGPRRRPGPGGFPPPGGPDGPRRPPPPDGGPQGPGPDDRPHEGPDGGPPDGPQGDRQRPGPDGGPGPRPPRPRISRLILSRVEAPNFDQGWFSPQKHDAQAPKGK